ncbi:hypothetical protein VOI32_35590 [Paraburkholderia caribensis]|uniref:Uncharacterized protein n=1 Tax=Paraburkholderia caribensis TaxID=75105 RepID=A0ABV0E9K7_9BURK|nr:hypothetical protein [Paraburkholderia caribensis]
MLVRFSGRQGTKGVRAQKVDNLKSAVLQRLVGQAPVFNPRYLDAACHWGFDIVACNVGKGNEYGAVKNMSQWFSTTPHRLSR